MAIVGVYHGSKEWVIIYHQGGGGGGDGRVEDLFVSQYNLSDPPLRLYSLPKTACPLYFVIDG